MGMEINEEKTRKQLRKINITKSWFQKINSICKLLTDKEKYQHEGGNTTTDNTDTEKEIFEHL